MKVVNECECITEFFFEREMIPVTKSSLEQEFGCLGINVSDVVLIKCVELCGTYRIDAETLVEQWTAFSVSCLKGAEPTVDLLIQLERKYLTKLTASTSLTGSQVTASPSTGNRTLKTNRGDRTKQFNESLLSDISILEEYGVSDFSLQLSTSNVAIEDDIPIESNEIKTVIDYKSPETASFSHESWLKVDHAPLHVKLPLSPPFEYMKQSLVSMKVKQCDQTDKVAKYLLNKYELKDLFTFIEISSEPFITYGRVIREDYGSKEVYLEGSNDFAPTQNAFLDLSQLDHYSLFSGQVIAIEAVCNETDVLIAKKVFCDASLPFKSIPVGDEQDHANLMPLQFMVVAGPYVNFNVSGEPQMAIFNKLVTFIKSAEFDVLILLGPFFDVSKDSFCKVTTTFANLYEKMLHLLVEQTKKMNIEIFVIPSNNELHHIPVYPTPPFSCNAFEKNVHFLPNPSVIEINDIVIGVSTSDVLFEMCKQEIVSRSHPVTDLIARCISHLIDQQSFFPIYPCSAPSSEVFNEDITAILDSQLTNKISSGIDFKSVTDYCNFGTYTPHVLILPSTFQHFIKVVKDCFVLNPGKCCRQKGGGTISRFRVYPGAKSIVKSISCEIMQL